MTTFNYKGMEYEEKNIVALISYSREVNRIYMARVLQHYFGTRWDIFAKEIFGDINQVMYLFQYNKTQKLLDDLSGLLEDLRKAVEWSELDEEAIRYLSIKYFAELPEEDRNHLNALFVASQQN